MNALKIEKPVADYKRRDHRMSKLPFKDVLTMQMDKLGIRNVDLASALGYPMPNVIAMIKKGSMRLPENKIADAARVLQLDPAFLMRKVVEENNPSLWDLIESTTGKSLVSENEMKLIDLVREALDGHDIDATKSAALTQSLVSNIHKLRDKVANENVATLERIERDKVSKVAKK